MEKTGVPSQVDSATPGEGPSGRVVVLGVTASDAHAVANHLIAYVLRLRGFHVVNLGTCTPVSEFCQALERNPTAEALVIGSLNGHAAEDLAELPGAKARGDVRCPVIVGGNLSVGSRKSADEHARLYALGVDHVLSNITELVELLERLPPRRGVEVAAVSGEVTTDGGW